MRYNNLFGIAAPEFGWVPAPSYILRRALILKIINKFPPGRILEIGCGGGALLNDLYRLGFHGICFEASPQARQLASLILANTSAFKIVDKLPDKISQLFDYVMAFEVLEHIEDDQEALITWTSHLKPGNILMISVPAHRNKWSAADEFAGHYRRYEYYEIVEKIKNAGLDIISIQTYGWPLSNILNPLRSLIFSLKLRKIANQKLEEMDKDTLTFQSGTERSLDTKVFPIYNNWIGNKIFSSLFKLQELVSHMDWGIGYLMVTRKRQ
jgi:SAM-dependent methyltransferase